MTFGELCFRNAVAEDLPRIVDLIAEDPISATRERVEHPLPASYIAAFEAIERDVNNSIIVAEHDGRIAGVLQLTVIPSLTFCGQPRAQLEGIHVARDSRGQGVGRQLVTYAIEQARQHGCHVLQLTSDKRRDAALQFYASLGFSASHEGLKLRLG